MYKRFICVVVMICGFYSTALLQNVIQDSELDALKHLADSIQKGSSDLVRISSAQAFDSLLHSLLQREVSMDFNFDLLKNLSVVNDDQNLIRVYTFICPLTAGKGYRYYGYVQYRAKKNSKPVLVKLMDVMPERKEAEKLIQSSNQWFGALYYKLIPAKAKEKTFYTLLGWRGVDRESTMKVIEVLSLDNGRVLFGSPLFLTDAGLRTRIIFEYNAQAVMSLNYEKKKKRIVFDHLSPPAPHLKDNFKTYGPDFTYDAFRWKRDKWELIKDIELRNPPSADPSKSPGKVKRKEFYNPEK